MINKQTLTRIANQAGRASQMVAHYPDPANEKVTFPPSPYYRFLKLLAEEINAEVSVELGVCGGGGSLHLAMGSQVAIGVDVVEDHPDNTNWIKKHYPNWNFLIGDSVYLAEIIFERFGQIDVLFIDTTHTHQQTLAEYRAYLPYFSERAIICLDDLFRPGMDLAWAELPETKERFDFLHPSASPTDGGFGVIW